MRYDTTLKELFQAPPPQFVHLLAGGQVSAMLTIEHPTVSMRRSDLVVRLTDGRLYHLELQSDNDSDMPWRMLDYYKLIRLQYGQEPLQQVVYVGSAPMRMAASIQETNLHFRYTLLDVRTIDSTILMASTVVADNLLAILCRAGDTRETVRRILQRVAVLPQQARTDALAKLLILAGLRQAQTLVIEEAEHMAITIDLAENPFLRQVFEDGEKQGMQQGESALLRRQLERRFGPLPEWAEQRLAAADTTTLEQWGLRLLEAPSLAEVLQ